MATLVAEPERRRCGRTTFLFLMFVGLYSLGCLQRVEAGSPPVVSNAHAEQRSGSQLVDITYDVDDAEGDSLTVSVQVSSDGGVTFTVPARTFSGDVGPGINPGVGKRIVWDAGKDAPDTYGTNYIAKVTADDGGAAAVPEGMVLIPAGEFLMGDEFNERSTDELPQHAVYLDAFLIDKYEVTNAQFKAFCKATARLYPSDPGFGGDYTSNYFLNKPQYPVVNVSWDAASAYTLWAGKRLPTEAEWEKAARGGLERKRYPWGDVISRDDANYLGTGGQDVWTKTSPVGSFSPNGYGLHDVGGNVWEWCGDFYDATYYSHSPGSNPSGPAGDPMWQRLVLRGGSCEEAADGVRVARRGYKFHFEGDYAGFRCARSLTP